MGSKSTLAGTRKEEPFISYRRSTIYCDPSYVKKTIVKHVSGEAFVANPGKQAGKEACQRFIAEVEAIEP